MTHPWTDDFLRPVSYIPEPPDKVNPKYCLYTRRNKDSCQVGTPFLFSTCTQVLRLIFTRDTKVCLNNTKKSPYLEENAGLDYKYNLVNAV